MMTAIAVAALSSAPDIAGENTRAAIAVTGSGRHFNWRTNTSDLQL